MSLLRHFTIPLLPGLVASAGLLGPAAGAAGQSAADAGPRVGQIVRGVAEGNTQFALDLYRNLRGEEGNLFISPHSISTALAMTYAGARGETAAQMAATSTA